jgi:hypothetical protein
MSYSICPSDPAEDHESILDLWQRNLPSASAERYTWLYEAGPATGLLLHAEGAQVIGSSGLMRRQLCAFGERLPAGQAIDLNVDHDHRTIGPALKLQRAVVDAVSRGELGLVYSFPNRQSEAVLRRIGYKVLGEVQRWLKPLSCRIALRRPSWPQLLPKVVAPLVDPLWRLKSRDMFYRRPPGLCVEQPDGFDARFDRLWQKASRQFPILGERTSEYLRWRFARSPEGPFDTLALVDPAGELCGYVIYRRHQDTIIVGDFLFADLDHLKPLLAQFLRLMWRQHADAVVIVCLASAPVRKVLERFGFWQRPSCWKAMIYADPQHAGDRAEQWLEADNWFFTRADMDTDQ